MQLRRVVTATAAVTTAAVLLAGCGLFGDGGDKSPSPSNSSSSSSVPSTSASPGALPPAVETKRITSGTNDGSIEVLFSVHGVYREGEHAQLLMSVRQDQGVGPANDDAQDVTIWLKRQRRPKADDSGITPTQGGDGIALVDPERLKAYLVARDAEEDQCLCPEGLLVDNEKTTSFNAVFAAPPRSSRSIDVTMPGVGYFKQVPVLDQQMPEIEETDALSTEAPVSDSAPARADIVDITGQESNIDLSVVRSRDKVTLDANVLFDFDKATLRSDAGSRIDEAVRVLKENARGKKVDVNGYTDSKGSDSYNKGLSERRAAAVRKAMEPKLKGTGITLVDQGYGEANPVAPNSKDGEDNPRGRELNRRVEIVYRK